MLDFLFIFRFGTGISAGLFLLFPNYVLLVMYNIRKSLIEIGGDKHPQEFDVELALLKNDFEKYCERHAQQVTLLRITGALALFMFVASWCLPNIR